MRVLVVEDEEKMVVLLSRGLKEEGHEVDVCSSGADAVEQAAAVPYDVVLLDWSLPDLDGVAVLRRWRDAGLRTPVLMLTARGSVGERVTGLRAGADDYLTKPFDFDELLARLEALHRRGGGHEVRRKLGRALLDANRRVLSVRDVEEALTAREYGLLSELAGHAGETLTRSELLTVVWGAGFDGTPNVVDVYVGYLRAKLRRLGIDEEVSVRAVRGTGYRLVIRDKA